MGLNCCAPTRIDPFGKSIECLACHGLCDTDNVPFVLKDCVNHLRHNIAVPGILINTAPPDLTMKAFRRVKRGKPPKYDKLGCPHVAADILKKFLQHLPVSLITVDSNRSFSTQFFNRIMHRSGRSNSGLNEELKRASIAFIRMMPAMHRSSLIYLLEFFCLVHHEETNGVSAGQLVQTFGPLMGRRRKNESKFLDGSVIIIEFAIENIVWIMSDE